MSAILKKSPNIDKNLLWGSLNIKKRQLCVNGILAQDLVFGLGPFQRGFGGFSGLRWRGGCFNDLPKSGRRL